METEQHQPTNERDPFPKMIIVCVVITAVLFLLITSVLMLDFALRSSDEQRVQPSSPNFFKVPVAPEIPALEPRPTAP